MTEASKGVIPPRGHRMSKLPIVQYCGLAGKLSDETGSIRPGHLSKWFHANCGEQWDEAQRLWMGMSDEEREEVQHWLRPARCTIDSNILDYAASEKELELGVDENANYVDPTLHQAMSVGHLDMAWVGTVSNGKRAFVGDIKRSRFTVKDGTNTLQLHAYGFAYASLRGCHSYRVGIWQAIEGVWIWGDAAVDLESSMAADIWARIRHAALNTDEEANKGAHCQQCWGRLKCPAYVLPAALASTELASFAHGGSITPDGALRALQLAQSMADLSGSVISACRAYVAQGGKITDPSTGLSYSQAMTRGRESVKVADVRKKFGAAADSIIRRGSEYPVWDWRKR